jgi:hypothetical protein
MAQGNGEDDTDNPLYFSGDIKDWPTFKEAIQSRADTRDTTCLLETGRALALFFARQINNHAPTSVDTYTVVALKEWFDDRDLATDLELSLTKNRLASMGYDNDHHHHQQFLRPHQVGVQRCKCTSQDTQGRRSQVPLTDEQNAGADLSRRRF